MYYTEVKANKGTNNGAMVLYALDRGINRPRTIHDAYRKPSIYKVDAYNDIKALCASLGGYNCSVVSANCFAFSMVFETPTEVHYFTKMYHYILVK